MKNDEKKKSPENLNEGGRVKQDNTYERETRERKGIIKDKMERLKKR